MNADNTIKNPEIKVEENEIFEVVADNVESATSEVSSTTTDIVVLSPELQKMFPSQEEKQHLYKLKWAYWWDLDKLEWLYREIVWLKVKRTMKEMNDKWISVKDIWKLLGDDVYDKMSDFEDKLSSMRDVSWTFEISDLSEKDKEIFISDNKYLNKMWNTFRRKKKRIIAWSIAWATIWTLVPIPFIWTWVWAIAWWISSLYVPDIKYNNELKKLKDSILWTEENFILLQSSQDKVSEIIEWVKNSKDWIIENANEYIKNYRIMSFITFELLELSENKKNELETMENKISKLSGEREIKKIESLVWRLEGNKHLIELYAQEEYELATQLEIISDDIEMEYYDTLSVVSATLMSLNAKQPIKKWLEWWVAMQKIKIAAIKTYEQSSNSLRNNITLLQESSKITKKQILDSIKSIDSNKKNNKKKLDTLRTDNRKLNGDIKIALDRLQVEEPSVETNELDGKTLLDSSEN